MTTFYTQGQFIDFCKKVFGFYRLTNGKSNIEVVCPICKRLKEKHSSRIYTNKKLSIHVDDHILHCWVCGYKSKNLIHLLKKYYPNHLQYYLDKFVSAEVLEVYNKHSQQFLTKAQTQVKLPNDFILLANSTEDTSSMINAARNYLKARRADSEDMLWYWRLGVTKSITEPCGRLVVPSFDPNGILNYYSARALQDNILPKYSNPEVLRENIIFNELNIDWSNELILVEGVFDLMRCPENATALLGTDLPSHFLLFQKIVEHQTPIVLALDPEAQKKSYEIAKRLLEFDIKVKVVELLPNQEDVGSLTKNQFNERLQNAKIFNKEFFLRSKINSIL